MTVACDHSPASASQPFGQHTTDSVAEVAHGEDVGTSKPGDMERASLSSSRTLEAAQPDLGKLSESTEEAHPADAGML